jgi:hypothetical protein
MNHTKIKPTTSKNTKFKKLNCHPKNRTKKYTCYDDNTLLMFKNLWNKKYPNNQIVSTDVLNIWNELNPEFKHNFNHVKVVDEEVIIVRKPRVEDEEVLIVKKPRVTIED